MAVGMPSLLRAAALLAAVRSTATQPVPSAEHTESCGDCGSSVKVGVDFLGNDVGSKTEQPSREACCEFCRVTNTATAWTYSTGADYPKACWCKTQESTNPGCVPPCPRVSGHILPPCLPWGWTFLVLLLVGSVLYAGIGIAYNAKVLGKDELPNTEFWGELAALVRDGIAYTFSTAATTVQDAARPTPRGDYDAIGGVDEEAGGAAAAGVDVEAEKILSKFRKKSKPAKTGPRTRLVEAAIIGRKKAVKELLREKEAKAELDCGDQRGATAFHHACAGGHLEVLELLVAAGCKTALTDDLGKTGWALALAAGASRREVTARLDQLATAGHKTLGLEAEARSHGYRGPPPAEGGGGSGVGMALGGGAERTSSSSRGTSSGRKSKRGKSKRSSSSASTMLALPPPPPAPERKSKRSSSSAATMPALPPPPPPPPPPFDPQEGEVVRYSGKGVGGNQLVTIHKIHRNVPLGEEPYIDVILPDGKHRDTTLERIAPNN